MKKIIKNLILFISFISFIQSGSCYTLNFEELNNEITKLAKKEIKEQIKEYSNDFELNITGIIKYPIITNENIAPKIELINQDSTFKINSYKRVVIKDSKNTIIKIFPINVQTLIYKDVLVADSIIQFNQEINSSNTKLERKEISKYLGKTISTKEINQLATKNYQKGNIILSNQLKEKSSVLKNSTIDIIFLSSKGLKIKLQGKALSEGAIGDTILVRSEKYNKTYNAIVNSSHQVTVRI